VDGSTVVSPRGDRSRYTGASQGAPPPPPPGGYRAARRVPPPPPPAVPASAVKVRSSILSRIALGAAATLALVLLIMWAARATGAIYAGVTLALQLAVVVAVVAALVDIRGRRLGGIALAIVLVINVGTIGAASALNFHPGSVVTADPEADHWAAYPGISGQSESEILARPSLEEVQRTADVVLAAVRARLTSEFGFEWVEGVAGGIRPERNGYGGESMLVQYTSENWATTTPVTDFELKHEVLDVIDDVLAEHGFWYLIAFNEPSSGFDPAYIERLYGSTDPRTQPLWASYSENEPDPLRFYVNISDLTHDDDGSFRAAREAEVAGTAEPLEGVQISFLALQVLSEADLEEFQERMQDY
jgi:hypothetical protein